MAKEEDAINLSKLGGICFWALPKHVDSATGWRGQENYVFIDTALFFVARTGTEGFMEYVVVSGDLVGHSVTPSLTRCAPVCRSRSGAGVHAGRLLTF